MWIGRGGSGGSVWIGRGGGGGSVWIGRGGGSVWIGRGGSGGSVWRGRGGGSVWIGRGGSVGGSAVAITLQHITRRNETSQTMQRYNRSVIIIFTNICILPDGHCRRSTDLPLKVNRVHTAGRMAAVSR